ncbi:MAG TPA: class I SAM-dependent rRNA methyltransferase [Bryobacteraceae bacterium]|nr:class I SAM-dependent rRNA methyltransferase [Bryobacteraceae bacterium]
MHAVKVNRKAANRLDSGHPWIFASDVLDRGSAGPGEAVHVFDPQHKPLGTAHYSSSSQITLRFLTRQLTEIGPSFYRDALQSAIAHRQRIVRDTDAYRLVHAEGDLLPGLIVDKYGDSLVIQTLTQAMDRAKDMVVEALTDLLHPASIVERNDASVRQREELPLHKGVLRGQAQESAIEMNGLRWQVDLLHGQKTGVYLDQRENYAAAARWGRGGKALDCFTSTGGFALHLARTCQSVEGVDSSAHALQTAARNQSNNNIANVTWRESDVFDALMSYGSARRHFDLIVLDPPAFAKSRGAVEGAGRGYKEINLRALRLLQRGGVLVTCSCSHHFNEGMLLQTVAEAALDAGRTLRILERRAQAQDHPVLLTVPETLYLKCLIFEVL